VFLVLLGFHDDPLQSHKGITLIGHLLEDLYFFLFINHAVVPSFSIWNIFSSEFPVLSLFFIPLPSP